MLKLDRPSDISKVAYVLDQQQKELNAGIQNDFA